MADTPTPQIVVNGSTAGTVIEQLSVIARYALVIIGSAGTILSFVKTKDLAGLIQFFKGSDGATVIAAATAVGTMAYGLYKTYIKRQKLVTVADAAPNKVAVVTKA